MLAASLLICSTEYYDSTVANNQMNVTELDIFSCCSLAGSRELSKKFEK